MDVNALNIRSKRKELKLTQKQLADILGVSFNTISNWERGEVIPETKFGIIKSFLNQEKHNIVNEPNLIPVSYNEMNVMLVPLVNKYAYAGYLNGFSDDEYIDDLPKITFADDVEHKGEYLCFEVKGDSMNDESHASYLEGDILLCRNVRKDYWKSKLHINKWDFVIVHKTDGILLKRIINHDVEKGLITIHSLNDYYQDKIIHLKDVFQIFNVVSVKRNLIRR
jgi:DNA-binding XRE family transcriptional regulator